MVEHDAGDRVREWIAGYDVLVDDQRVFRQGEHGIGRVVGCRDPSSKSCVVGEQQPKGAQVPAPAGRHVGGRVALQVAFDGMVGFEDVVRLQAAVGGGERTG